MVAVSILTKIDCAHIQKKCMFIAHMKMGQTHACNKTEFCTAVIVYYGVKSTPGKSKINIHTQAQQHQKVEGMQTEATIVIGLPEPFPG